MRFLAWFSLFEFLLLADICDAFTNVAKRRSREVRCQFPIIQSSILSKNDARHSYVEGEAYDDRFNEIEAMGGDPFFLDEEDESDERNEKAEENDTSMLLQNSHLSSLIAKASSVSSSRSATDGLGPTPMQSKNTSKNDDENWEWDGSVDEDAHLGFD